MLSYLKGKEIKGKRVVLRLDLNVPLTDSGNYVADDFRIQKSLASIRYLLDRGNTVIVLAHFGRPKGVTDAKFSLLPVARKLASLLQLELATTKFDLPSGIRKQLVFYTGNLMDTVHQKNLATIRMGSIVLCENIRFYSDEEENSRVLGKHLSELGDVYVNDAFSVCHHASSSTSAITEFLPSYAGLQLEDEIKGLSRVLNSAPKPFVVLMGGAKIVDKTKVLRALAEHADQILLTGKLANEILQSQDYDMNMPDIDSETLHEAKEFYRNYSKLLTLPKDFIIGNTTQPVDAVEKKLGDHFDGKLALDIGTQTILAYSRILRQAGTIVWNGPAGWFEQKPFDTGTMSLAHVLGSAGKRKAYVVVGGGETVDAVRLAKQEENIDLLSTGGGAMLSFLAGETLPGIAALEVYPGA